KGLGFVIEMEAGLPESMASDRQLVEQILNNLLANALKFTERGQVAFRLARPEPSWRGRLRAEQAIALILSDTGPGIAPEHQRRIFAPFEQVESSSDRKHGGTGLGLAIAREFAT